jgi:tetratricopeptide (TPR) repeat protein
VARLTRDPEALLRALILIPQSFPAVVWLGTVGASAIALACFLGAATVGGLCLLRGLPHLGHALGHLFASRPQAAWPGVLFLGAALALLPLVGVGPALLIGAAGGLALTCVPRRQGWVMAGLLVAGGVALGPLLEPFAGLATAPIPGSGLFAAWRMERTQPLPSDRAVLEARLDRGVERPVERLALAMARKREGDLEGTEALLEPLLDSTSPAIAGRAANLKGSIALARGDVRDAIRLYREALQSGDSAPVLYNLSRSYGRAIELDNQRRAFAAAKTLAPSLVSQATVYDGNNFHHYLLDDPVPVYTYLSQALAAGPDAKLLASYIRRRALGRSVPEWGWMLLPLLALTGLGLGARSGLSCGRCLRFVCERCTPPRGREAICLRCRRLAAADDTADPRMLRRELRRDRWRQLLLGRGLALLGAGVPGSAAVLEGRAALGALVLTMLFAGVFLFLAHSHLPTPTEVGALGPLIALSGAVVLIGSAYLAGWSRVATRWARGGKPE